MIERVNNEVTPTSVSRRTFVQAAGALVALPMALGMGRSPQGNAPLKVGLIGCGGRGTGAAVQALRADPGAVLWAAGDIFADRLAASVVAISGEVEIGKVDLPEERRFVGFDAYQKVINSGVDVVLLTTHPVFRPLHLAAAVKAGKHVFAEKPLGVDAPGVRSALDSARTAREKGLQVVVGFCWRYHDGMRATFEALRQGEIGEVVTVHSTYHTGTLSRHPRKAEWSDLEFQFRNWWHFTWISGDHIVEQAVHSIDRMAWAFGDRIPARVVCVGGRAARFGPEHGNVFDHFAAAYEYDDGARAFHACRQIDGCPADNTDYVYGTRGAATINGWTPTFDMRDRAGKPLWRHDKPETRDMYQAEHDRLFAAIRGEQPGVNELERGANSTMMAIMARMAAYTGKTVTWKQAMESEENLTPRDLAWGAWPTPEVPVPGRG